MSEKGIRFKWRQLKLDKQNKKHERKSEKRLKENSHLKSNQIQKSINVDINLILKFSPRVFSIIASHE